MEQMHATYQALKTTTEHLYTEIHTKEQEEAVSRVKLALETAIHALEDELGITKAQKEALERKTAEDKPTPTAQTGAPSVITKSPGDIAAAVTDAANRTSAS